MKFLRSLEKYTKMLLFRLVITALMLSIVSVIIPRTEAAASQATIAWDPPTTYADGSPVTNLGGYKVYTGTASGNYSRIENVGNLTSWTVANLADGATYYFAVTAYDTAGDESSFSSEINKTFAAASLSWTLTAAAGSGGSILPQGNVPTNQASDGSTTFTTVSIVNGGSQSLTITPNSGYKIGAVTVDGVSVGAVSSYTFSNVTANHTIAATFVQNITAYTITASSGTNGSITPAGATTVTAGASQVYTISPNTGNYIVDVLVDGVSVGRGSSYTFSNVTANHTISATFATATYTITASAGVNGSITPAGTTRINYGTSQSCTITPNSGYKIGTVTVDGVSVGAVSSYTFSNVTANHTIAATFVQNIITAYTITASSGTNGSITPAGATPVTAGASQSYTITPNSGYKIGAVTVDGVSVGAVSSYTFSNVTANHTIAATFVQNITAYTITVSSGTNGSITPAGATTVTAGASQAYTITPNSGYKIGAVTVDGVSVGAVSSYTFSNVTANHTIAATFVQNITAYTITASSGTNGSITPAGATTVTAGASQVYTISPNTGNYIVDVKVDGVSVGRGTSYTFSNVTANHTISATFATATYTITASAGVNGSITPAGTTRINYGTSQSCTITPNSGYNIGAVTVDGVSVGAVSSYTFSNVTANHTIAATFVQNIVTNNRKIK